MAVSRIKGITVEINGSTTGLDKALKSVNSTISQTQGALKDVNRLLKLDPGNAELLTQKQKLLKEAVSETKEKLDALKMASEQAAKTVGNYDAWKKAYTPIQEEIGKTREKVKTLKEKMAELEKAGKVDTSEYKRLGAELKNEQGYLDDLKKKAKEVSDEFGNPISHEQYDALQREIIETEQRLESLKSQAKEAASVLGSQMQLAGSKLQEAGSKVTDAGKALMPVSAAVTGMGTAAFAMASNFEDAMAKVSTIADESEVPIGDLEKAILNLSDETGIAAADIADNVYNAISAGQSTGDAVNFVSNATKLAKAGFAESADALDILTTIMNAYGMEADQVTNVSDMLIQTQNLGKTTVAELSSAMGKVIPTAKAQGVQLDDLCASYAVMTSNGIATAETTTYLNSMLNELGKQGTTAAAAFAEGTEHIKEGGLTMAEAMEMGWELTDVLDTLDEQAAISGTSISNMFSSAEAGKAASVLWDNAQKLNGAVEQMGNSAGATETAFGKLDTTSNEIQISVNQLKNTAIDLGGTLMETLQPAIKEASDKVKEFSDWFKSLDEDQKQTIVMVGLIVAAGAPLLVMLGTLISSIGTIISVAGGMLTALAGLNPVFLAVAAAVAAVIAIGVALYQNWDTIKEKAAELGQWVSEKWEGLKTETAEKWEAVKNAVSEKISAAKEKAASTAGEIKTRLSESFNTAKTNVSNAMNDIKTSVSQKLQDARSAASDKLDSIRNKFSSAFENAKTTVRSALDKIKGFFNFSWSLPKIKMPHFGISGKFSLNPPSTPHFSVEWYKKAMNKAYVLKGASIFGAMGGKLLGGGESGSEVVAGTQYMMDLIREATARNNQGMAQAVISTGNRIADIMAEYFPVFAENGETEMCVKMEPHFSVMVGNKQFDDYIVRTAEKGISGQQISGRKARGRK